MLSGTPTSLQYFRARATTILGANSQFACPVCLVPREFLCDLPGNIYPLRTRNGTLTLLARADRCTTKSEAHKILLEQSIRNVPVSLLLRLFGVECRSDFQYQNTLLNYFSYYACVYQSYSSDPLHQIRQGVWGQHFWKWFKDVYLSNSELRELDGLYVFRFLPCVILLIFW